MCRSYTLPGLRLHACLDFLPGAVERSLLATEILWARQAAQCFFFSSLHELCILALCIIGSNCHFRLQAN